jgi:S1-C subfamily serine protease
VARVRGSVLRVEAKAPAADHRGTGFVVGPRLVVTCAHLVQGTSAVAVVLPDGQAARARVERLDALNDLAVLTTAVDLPTPLALDPSGRVEPGELIAITGFPSSPENPQGARDWTVPGQMVGWVTRASPTGDRVQMLQVLADIRPGHSGGPVYSLRNGRVLGVMSFRVTAESTSGFAAGIPMLQPLLGVPSAAPTPGAGSTFEATP